MMFKKSLIAVFLSAATLPAFALEVPSKSPFDDRIRFIDYNPAEVIKLVAHFGFSTDIQFGDGEEIKVIALGDPSAWDTASASNHILLRPIGEKPDTNMTVITNKRVYNFDLRAHWSKQKTKSRSDDMMFQINFRYPKEEAEKALANARTKAEIEEAKRKEEELVNKLEQKLDTPKNWNYWAKGSSSVSPDQAYDDNLFTYLTFNNNKDMPAVYIINEDGSESLVNTNIDPENPDTIQVHKVARRLILRKGNNVACIFNQSYNAVGISNITGTTSPNVIRKIRGQ